MPSESDKRNAIEKVASDLVKHHKYEPREAERVVRDNWVKHEQREADKQPRKKDRNG